MCDKMFLKFLYDDNSCFSMQLIHFKVPTVVTGAVFIDLTFDTVNHSILLSKLCSLGVPNASPAYNWLPIDAK